MWGLWYYHQEPARFCKRVSTQDISEETGQTGGLVTSELPGLTDVPEGEVGFDLTQKEQRSKLTSVVGIR